MTSQNRVATNLGTHIVIDLRQAGARDEAAIDAIWGARHRSRYEAYVKPGIDRLSGGLILVLITPIFLLIGLAVLLAMGRPVLFRQQRVGLGGRHFTMYKFRTMLPDRRRTSLSFAGLDRRHLHKSPCDPRLTPLGRFLRKWSLDELPQLLNVMKGDMSLVGPRPELVEIVQSYQPWQHLRHQVKPGVTGLWQVTARSNGSLMHENTEIDLNYVERISFRTDWSILWRTLPAVLGSRTGF